MMHHLVVSANPQANVQSPQTEFTVQGGAVPFCDSVPPEALKAGPASKRQYNRTDLTTCHTNPLRPQSQVKRNQSVAN